MDWTSLCLAIVIVVLCIAPAVRVPAVVHRVAAHRARGTYLTIAAGHTTHLSRDQRRRHWKRALQYISRILRLRKRWAALGKFLQTPRIQDLVVGLSRRTGKLTRIYDPAFAEGPVAKVRAQPRRRTPAAATESP